MSKRVVQEVFVVVTIVDNVRGDQWGDGRTFTCYQEAEDYIRHDALVPDYRFETFRIEKRFRVREVDA